MLSGSLGDEHAMVVVTAATLRLGISDTVLDSIQVNEVLGDLARTPGMVGVAARFALSRNDAWSIPSNVPPPLLTRELPLDELVDLLSGTVGRERASEVVNEAAQQLGLSSPTLDEQQFLTLLERLAEQPGLIGITARFAKARALLRFG